MFHPNWVALCTALLSTSAAAQVPRLAEVPDDLPPSVQAQLVTRKTLLEGRKTQIARDAAEHNQRCGSVPEGSEQNASCAAAKATLEASIARYGKDVQAFNDHVFSAQRAAQTRSPANRPQAESCSGVARRLQHDRDAIEQLRRENLRNQADLAEWSSLSAQSQRDALLASVKFVLGEYAADLHEVERSASKLRSDAAYLERRATSSSKHQTMVRYFQAMDSVLAKLRPIEVSRIVKTFSRSALDADQAWRVARGTMYDEFRVAAHTNDGLRDVLNDPEFRDAFVGGTTDTPGLDVIAELAAIASEDAGRRMLGLQRYEAYTGPTVRAAMFVRDVTYDALLSLLSTQRAEEQSELASAVVTAAATLQREYRSSIDSMQACRTGK
jgi:hypothetical protein